MRPYDRFPSMRLAVPHVIWPRARPPQLFPPRGVLIQLRALDETKQRGNS